MPHPDAFQLQCYLDGELPHPLRERIRLHIEQCPYCQERVQTWHRLGLALKKGLPMERMFLPEAKFWLRLADKMAMRKPRIWPLVPYLPPLLLGIAGTLIQVLISITLVAYHLTGLGLIPSLSPVVSDGLSTLASHRGVHQWLERWLGWSSSGEFRHTIGYWESLHWVIRNVIIFVTLLLALGTLMFVIVALYSSWALCWSKSNRSSCQKEVSDHGIRSHH